jgi:hypothetical protein
VLLRFVGGVSLVAFGVGGCARIHAMASTTVVVSSAPNDRACEYDRNKQEEIPSIQHSRFHGYGIGDFRASNPEVVMQ